MAKTTVATVFGTRPEIIKLSSYIEEMDRRTNRHFLIHTNQHYDYQMDLVFFRELEIRRPDFRLTAEPGNQTAQLGQMISQLAAVYANIKPDWVVVLGDTNSTVAGAVSAKKSGIKLAHIESGCRSFDPSMPEEQNRLLADHVSDLLFAPTKECVKNLSNEGVSGPKVKLVGSTLVEVCKRNLEIAERKASVEVHPPYALMTIHRRGNIEDRRRLKAIVSAMARVSQKIPVIFPMHPHTSQKLAEFGLDKSLGKIQVVPALGYLDFIYALSKAEFVLTDSGGVQQEAQVFRIPTLTARKETEWVETVKSGASILVDANEQAIARNGLRIVKNPAFKKKLRSAKNPYLESGVAKKIVSAIMQTKKRK
jgi:UDP-N-acetylglucosamine 2-epimerase (non-hydrolysing)